MGAARYMPNIVIKPPLGVYLLIFPQGYLMSFPQVDTSARQRGLEIILLSLLCELPSSFTCHLPFIPLATSTKQMVFAYNKVSKPHHSYRPLSGLPRGEHRTHHMWICQQLSGARRVDSEVTRHLYIDVLHVKIQFSSTT